MQDDQKANRLIRIMMFGVAGLAVLVLPGLVAIVAAVRDFHIHVEGIVIPAAPVVASLSTIGASLLAFAAARLMTSARKALKTLVASDEPGATENSPPPNPGQDPKPPRPRRLPRTRRQVSQYHLPSG